MKLYKYVSVERADVLKKGMIRFSQPLALNDPFELTPSFSSHFSDAYVEGHFEETLTDVFSEPKMREVYQSMPADFRTNITYEQFREYAMSLPRENLLQTTKQMRDKSLEAINRGELPNWDQHVGILSLAEKPDSLLMWSHYADSHRGFVFEFDTSHAFFSRFGSDRLKKVRYSQQRPIFESPQVLQNMNAIETILLTKSIEWEYEQEWRMLVPLVKADKVSGGPQDPRSCLPFSASLRCGNCRDFGLPHV
jgi:DUF2971 family protein